MKTVQDWRIPPIQCSKSCLQGAVYNFQRYRFCTYFKHFVILAFQYLYLYWIRRQVTQGLPFSDAEGGNASNAHGVVLSLHVQLPDQKVKQETCNLWTCIYTLIIPYVLFCTFSFWGKEEKKESLIWFPTLPHNQSQENSLSYSLS